MNINKDCWMREQLWNVLNDGDGNDEIAAIWVDRAHATWCTWYDEVDTEPECKFTDAEWTEITGRFNEMDWQHVEEILDEICQDVVNRREA